jgi:hypothetical protein
MIYLIIAEGVLAMPSDDSRCDWSEETSILLKSSLNCDVEIEKYQPPHFA